MNAVSGKLVATLLFLLAVCFKAGAQTDDKIVVHLLGNDKIADVNLDQDAFIAQLGKAVELAKAEFGSLPETQQLALIITYRKQGNPDLKLFAKPEMSREQKQAILGKVGSLQAGHTKLVDFPVAITLNVSDPDLSKTFTDFAMPLEKQGQQYKAAGLKEQYELNRTWAAKEVLPVLSAYEVIVEEKFAGVLNFGQTVAKTDFSTTQNVDRLTSTNSWYWRAVMEMNKGNPLIVATRIFMLVSQGQLDHAKTELQIALLFSDDESIPGAYLNMLSQRLDLFDEQLNAAIGKGIEQHDKGDFPAALAQYKQVLSQYPHSAWALYKQYYSQDALDVKLGKVKKEDRKAWDAAKGVIYRENPLYATDVRASNGREGYLLFRRQSMHELFQKQGETLNDVRRYADIALDLGVYDFAAQLYWYCFTYDKTDREAALNKYLYCLEQLGVKDLKENFKGDFNKIFRQIADSRDQAMKESEIYKSFKN